MKKRPSDDDHIFLVAGDGLSLRSSAPKETRASTSFLSALHDPTTMHRFQRCGRKFNMTQYQEKKTSDANLFFLVAGARFELATSWL